MQNSNLILLLRSMNSRERRECRQWLESPAHNTRPEALRLYDYLTDEATGFRDECLVPELIWECLHPGKPWNANLFRQLTHHVLSCIEEFIIYKQFKKDAVQGQVCLLQSLRERRLDKLFEKRLRETEALQAEQNLRNSAFWENGYKIEIERFTFAENQTRTSPLQLQEISDALDIQYMAHRLRNECALYSRQTVYKSNYESRLLPEILGKIETLGWQDIPAIGVYYYCYLALSKGEAAHFDALIDRLPLAQQCLPRNEVRDVYLVALNYVIKRINSGDPQAVRQAFDLYRQGIEQGYLVNNGLLSQWTYRNVVICGTRLGEFDWTEHFIEQYAPRLERKHRLSMQQECLSRLYYARKDYRKAMQLLVQVEFKDILQHLTAKTMLAKIYYELREWEALDSLLVSMKAYLRRKRVIGYHQENYGNIIKTMQKMLALNPTDREAVKRFAEEVQQTAPLTEKTWILEQLGQA